MHSNNIVKELGSYPDNAVYIISNMYDSKVMISVVRNATAWIARQVQDIKMGVHKCGTNIEGIYISQVGAPSQDYVILGLHRSDLCKYYKERGYKVYAQKSSKVKVRYVIRQNKAFLQMVNSRNRVIAQMNFATVPLAKAFAEGKTMSQLVTAIKEEQAYEARPATIER